MIHMHDIQMMLLASKEAQTNPTKFKFGCVAVDSSYRVIAVAQNNPIKSHPRQKYYAVRVGKPENIFLHAEIQALVRCRSDPYAIYVVRLLADGGFGVSRPCPICKEAMKVAGVKKCFYTDEKGMIVKEILYENRAD